MKYAKAVKVGGLVGSDRLSEVEMESFEGNGAIHVRLCPGTQIDPSAEVREIRVLTPLLDGVRGVDGNAQGTNLNAADLPYCSR